jgi:D-alanyl-D-alanine carboxypeptidase
LRPSYPSLLAGLLLALPAEGQQQPRRGEDSIAASLQRLADSVVAARPRLPGLLVFVKSGRLGSQWAVASGRSDTSRNLPLRPEQPVRIASNTKTYTAAAILRLMEQGRLRLSDPLSRHLPAELNTLLERDGYRTSQITIEQVLSHRSGLAEHPAVPSYLEYLVQRPEKRWTRLEQVQWLVDSLEPIGAPGERFRYSDTGYILLGAIIERYTGRNLGAGIRELLGFAKLGLRRTWFETLEPVPTGVAERAHQYIRGVDSYQHDPSFDLFGGGGIVAPLEELAGFVEALLRGRVFEHRATLDTMLAARSPELGGYGLGIYANNQSGHTGFGHSGFWGTVALHFPEDELTVAVAVTEQSQYGAIFGIVGAVGRMFFTPPQRR